MGEGGDTMTFKKKLLPIMLSVMMVFAMTPMFAFAADDTGTHNYIIMFHMENGSTLYNARVVDDAFKNCLGTKVESVGAMMMNGNFRIELKTNTPITYADIQGRNGALNAVHTTPGIQPEGTVIGYGRLDSVDKYANMGAFETERSSTELLPENETVNFYTFVETTINTIQMNVDAPVCGTKVSENEENHAPDTFIDVILSEDALYFVPEMTVGGKKVTSAVWATGDPSILDEMQPFYGTMKGDKEYGMRIGLMPKFGYRFGDYLDVQYIKINGENAASFEYDPESGYLFVAGTIKAQHEWNTTGKVTKKPTLKSEGVKTFKCKHCTATKTKAIPKLKANTLNVKGLTKAVKYSKVKKASQKILRKNVIKYVKAGQGTKTFFKVKGNSKITIAKTTGKVTVKKGLKKGTYKVTVKVKAKGTATYAPITKNVTFTIKVK